MTKYNKHQIADRIKRTYSKVTASKVTFWANKKLVLPSDHDTLAGRAREWDDQCLIEFGMVAILTDKGASLKTIEAIMDGLRKSYPRFLSGKESGFVELVFIEWESASGNTKQKFHQIVAETDVLNFMGKNTVNPKIIIHIFWLGALRELAEKMVKGA